jgi:hypothetical protein
MIKTGQRPLASLSIMRDNCRPAVDWPINTLGLADSCVTMYTPGVALLDLFQQRLPPHINSAVKQLKL